MSIFLISIHVEKSPPAFPLAAAILKTALLKDKRTSALTVRLMEYYLPLDIKNTASEIIDAGAEVCCLSAYTWNSDEIIQLSGELKRLKSDIRIIAGGPQATAAAEDFLKTGLFSSVLKGEGEKQIAAAVSSSPGKREIFVSSLADFGTDNSPYNAVNDIINNHEGILWEVSRGCPYSCSFCYESRGCKTIRTISADRMTEELQLFRKNNIGMIWVLDPTFNHNKNHAEKVLDLILKHHPGAHYTFEVRAELMNVKLCKMLSMLDVSLQIGLQTTNPDALKLINRSLSKQKFLQKCRMMSEYGLTFGIDLIYGLPGDNYSTFCDSLDFAISAAPNNIDIFPLSVLPGTELAEKSEELGLNNSGFPDYRIIDNNTYSMAEMAKSACLTKSVDMLYNREQAFAWLNTAASALESRPSNLFKAFNKYKHDDALDFIKSEFRRKKKMDLLPVIESFISWSRAAETAFTNPDREIQVRLCRKPEILDELAQCSPEEFLQRHPSGKNRNYKLFFDGEDLFIN